MRRKGRALIQCNCYTEYGAFETCTVSCVSLSRQFCLLLWSIGVRLSSSIQLWHSSGRGSSGDACKVEINSDCGIWPPTSCPSTTCLYDENQFYKHVLAFETIEQSFRYRTICFCVWSVTDAVWSW